MSVFTKQEALKGARDFFNGDDLIATVWVNKYALKNGQGLYVENSPKQRFEAIASEISRIDRSYQDTIYTKKDFADAMIDGRIIPGGSALFGIANPHSKSSLGNCFVISGDNEDSYGSVCKNDQEIVQIAKRRGGVGLDISHYRPNGTSVANAAGSSTGAVSFMHRFSNSTREVGQEGRRGALMLSMHCNHPEIQKFINIKNDDTSVTGANISVKLTDEFMNAVEQDGLHQLRYPVDIDRVMKLSMDRNIQYNFNEGSRKNIKARDVFSMMVKSNWKRAEPGALFWDTIKRESPADCYPGYQTESTNPCGEIPLSPYDSCRLLSVNLTKYVIDPFTSDARFDYTSFTKDVELAYRMMDNIIDLEIEKLKEIINKIKSDPESDATKATELAMWEKILKTTVEGRRAGMSIIGHGDTLAMLGLKYGSKEGSDKLVDIHRIFAIIVYEASEKLAETRGAFAVYDPKLEEDNPFLKRVGAILPRRNIALLTIPPSGTLSLLLNNQSSGFEPVFMLYYERSVKVAEGMDFDYEDAVGDKWKVYPVFHPNFLKWATVNGISEEELVKDLDTYIAMSPYAGATANEIDPVTKVKLQGAVQKWIDHAISVTHNLPEDVAEETIADIYMEAWKAGCKGCTIYRDKCRTGILNETGANSKESDEFTHVRAMPRPKELACDVFHPKIQGKPFIVLVGLLQGKPYEVFALQKSDTIKLPESFLHGKLVKRKSGVYDLVKEDGTMVIDNITSKFASPEWEDRTRMISMALRHRASIDYIVEQLNKSNPEGAMVYVSKVIARQLKKYITKEKPVNMPCPECGQEMTVEGGCGTCKHCGYGKCG